MRRDLAIDSVFGRSRRLGFGENQRVYHFAGSGSGGTAREWAATSNHNQLGDPAKGAAAIVTVATSTEPPLRVQLGTDSLAGVEAKLAQVATELAAWRTLAQSTDHEQTGMSLPPV